MAPLGSKYGVKLYTQELLDAAAATYNLAMNSEVTIYAIAGEPVLSKITGKYTTPHTDKYSGPARIKPLRTTTRGLTPGDDSPVQSILVSIPMSDALSIEFEENDQVLITSAEFNPELEDYLLIVSDVVDSDHPFERTLMTNYNQGFKNG